jgi:hypothetical protein
MANSNEIFVSRKLKLFNKNQQKAKYYKDGELKGAHKRFNKVMFNRYDSPARDILKKQLGDFITDNPDVYGQDFLINSSDCKYKYLEIQVCANWLNKDDPYPYKNVNIYERKAKYTDDTLFLTLNKNMTCGYIFSAKTFRDSKPRRLKKYSREFVYDVPWSRVMKIYVHTLDKEAIEAY